MELANFTLQNQDPQRPSGTCEVGGHPARATFDRRNPAAAKLTVQFGDGEVTPLPPDAIDCAQIHIRGTAVPVQIVNLGDGTEALRGQIAPALADAVTGAATAASPAAPEPAAPVPDVSDPLVALSRKRASAKRAADAHAARVKSLQSEAADLRARAEAAESELEAADAASAAHEERCAELLQQIRDLLDAEEV